MARLRALIPSLPLALKEFESWAEEMGKTELEKALVRDISLRKYIISNADRNLQIKFKGEVPKKIFSFRQMTADEWITNIVMCMVV